MDDDTRKFMIIAVPGGFIAFMLLLSFITGANPIESFILLAWQVIMYIGGLFIFGTPVFLLVSFARMTWSESSKDEENDDDLIDLNLAPKKSKKPQAAAAQAAQQAAMQKVAANKQQSENTRHTKLED